LRAEIEHFQMGGRINWAAHWPAPPLCSAPIGQPDKKMDFKPKKMADATSAAGRRSCNGAIN